MKFTLENLFEELEPNELDDIMPDDFDEKLPKRALKRIEKNALQKSGIKNSKRRLAIRIFAPAAACLVFAAGIGGYAIAAEAKEYNAAVDFFEQNGLSADGLSREDLKAVYRDITTNRFTNDKTVEVIRRSVPGVEILQEEPTPEELSVLWNSNINASSVSSTKNAVEYRWDLEYQPGADYYEWDKIIVECLRGGETLWKTEFSTLGKKWTDDELHFENGVMTSAGSAVWGQRTHWAVANEDYKSHSLDYGWIARIDDNGNKLWQHELNHGFENEYIRAVLENSDGTWAVISEGDSEYLCLSQFDIDGNELSIQRTKVDGLRIRNAARLGDGYLVQTAGGGASLVKLDHTGNIIDNFVYESDDCNYYITDMAEFEGNVYLSAYAVPKPDDDGYKDGIYEIVNQIISDKGGLDVSPEELTPAVRAHYTAVLLLCDPNGGEPKNFYSVKSSLGGKLAVENDQLKWNAENIILVGYSPYISSFPIGGKCKVYQYSFDSSGVPAGCEDTGELTHYLR